jgi:aminopeptidase N
VVRGGDASYFVEAEACLALGRTRAPSAPQLLRDAARRDAYQDVIRQHAYRGLAEARDDGAIPFLLESSAWGKHSQGRRAALGAAANLVKGRRDRESRDVREHIERLLEDKDFRVQAAAIEGLSTVGDPSAVAALRKVIARELDGRLRRRASEVIRDLEEGRAPAEETSRLRDELGQLRDAVLKLRDQVERMQLDAAHEGAKKERDKKDRKDDKKEKEKDKERKKGKK